MVNIILIFLSLCARCIPKKNINKTELNLLINLSFISIYSSFILQIMQEAFQSQSMEKMYEVAESMDPHVFQEHLQRCIDSGLWIPNAKEEAERQAASSAKEEKDGEKETSEQ